MLEATIEKQIIELGIDFFLLLCICRPLCCDDNRINRQPISSSLFVTSKLMHSLTKLPSDFDLKACYEHARVIKMQAQTRKDYEKIHSKAT